MELTLQYVLFTIYIHILVGGLDRGAPNRFSGCCALVPSSYISHRIFKNCSRNECLGISIYLRTVVRKRKSLLHAKYLYSNKSPLLCQPNFMEIITLSQSQDKSGDNTRLETVVLVISKTVVFKYFGSIFML